MTLRPSAQTRITLSPLEIFKLSGARIIESDECARVFSLPPTVSENFLNPLSTLLCFNVLFFSSRSPPTGPRLADNRINPKPGVGAPKSRFTLRSRRIDTTPNAIYEFWFFTMLWSTSIKTIVVLKATSRDVIILCYIILCVTPYASGGNLILIFLI